MFSAPLNLLAIFHRPKRVMSTGVLKARSGDTLCLLAVAYTPKQKGASFRQRLPPND